MTCGLKKATSSRFLTSRNQESKCGLLDRTDIRGSQRPAKISEILTMDKTNGTPVLSVVSNSAENGFLPAETLFGQQACKKLVFCFFLKRSVSLLFHQRIGVLGGRRY